MSFVTKSKRDLLVQIIENCSDAKRSAFQFIDRDRRFEARLLVESILRGFMTLDERDRERLASRGLAVIERERSK